MGVRCTVPVRGLGALYLMGLYLKKGLGGLLYTCRGGGGGWQELPVGGAIGALYL